MIITKLSGGLGNQLFQYTAGRRLAEKHHTILKLDSSTLDSHDTKRDYILGYFNINAEIAKSEEIAFVSDINISFKKRFFWNINHKLGLNHVGLVLGKHFHFEPRILNTPNNTYIHGHWQSEKYFTAISGLIRKELTVTNVQTGKNLEMAQKIVNSNSVSLHIRRQDYVTNKNFNKIYNVCDMDYYSRAIECIADKIPNPEFFIFSDDIIWAKENMNLKFPTTFVDFNDDEKNYEDLRLMSQCKHNIIANSTFSWWGAWLNNNPDKIVIAPKKWFGVKKWNTKDIIPESWIKI